MKIAAENVKELFDLPGKTAIVTGGAKYRRSSLFIFG